VHKGCDQLECEMLNEIEENKKLRVINTSTMSMFLIQLTSSIFEQFLSRCVEGGISNSQVFLIHQDCL
jgi:hypothetical protein